MTQEDSLAGHFGAKTIGIVRKTSANGFDLRWRWRGLHEFVSHLLSSCPVFIHRRATEDERQGEKIIKITDDRIRENTEKKKNHGFLYLDCKLKISASVTLKSLCRP